MTIRAALCVIALAMLLGVSYASEPEPLMLIDLTEGKLNAELQNAKFGDVMAEIANRAGFEVAIESGISQRTLSTKFVNMDVKRAIIRMLTLIGQKTYFVHYTPEGEIKKIEVYSTAVKQSAPEPTVRGPRKAPSSIEPPVTPPQYN